MPIFRRRDEITRRVLTPLSKGEWHSLSYQNHRRFQQANEAGIKVRPGLQLFQREPACQENNQPAPGFSSRKVPAGSGRPDGKELASKKNPPRKQARKPPRPPAPKNRLPVLR